jgi:hypothetical protein
MVRHDRAGNVRVRCGLRTQGVASRAALSGAFAPKGYGLARPGEEWRSLDRWLTLRPGEARSGLRMQAVASSDRCYRVRLHRRDRLG